MIKSQANDAAIVKSRVQINCSDVLSATDGACFVCMHLAVLVAVLQAYGIKSAEIAEQGCRAMVNLAVGNAAHATALIAAGACEGECIRGLK